jgi:hypothetical protein
MSQQGDPPPTFDYSDLPQPKRARHFATLAGRISLYAIVLQILWASILIPWYAVGVMEIIGSPPWKQRYLVLLLLWPAFIGITFGILSVKTAGISRRNTAGAIGLSFWIIFVVCIILHARFSH